MKIVHNNVKYMTKTSPDCAIYPLIGNWGSRSEWRDLKLRNRLCACAVKICLKSLKHLPYHQCLFPLDHDGHGRF